MPTVNHMNPPPAPSELTVLEAVQEKGIRWRVTFQWMDNAPEENVTNFQLTQLNGEPGTTQSAYAENYGEGTGIRTATIVVPKGRYKATAYCINQHENGVGIPSVRSNEVEVDAQKGNKP